MMEFFIYFPRRHWLFLLICVLLLSSILSYLFGQITIDQQKLGQLTYQISRPNSSVFSLYTSTGSLYTSSYKHQAAALDFLRVNPGKFLGPKLFPEDIAQNVQLQRSIVDSTENFVYRIGTEHYFFQQMIQKVPVYGGIVAVHIQNGNEIYAASGVIVVSKSEKLGTIDLQSATSIAEEKARNEGAIGRLLISDVQNYMLNLQALGVNNDNITHPVFSILITSGTIPITFSKKYFVDKNTGKVIYEEDALETALVRNIYNCHGTTNCTIARQEGQTSIQDSDVNKLYSIFEQVYNYYYNIFGRDSYDNHGAPLNGYVHRANIASYACPNAAWVNGEIQACNNMVDLSIIAHELTHAVTQHTAGLLYLKQSGALNESNSDIFSSAITHQWSIGADLQLPGITTPLRYLSDPPLRGQPDKLFSPYYACTSEDNGGIHTNMGVMSKAIYLMAVGGDFNGCHINSIGDKSYAIEYRTLTRYLTPSANFLDMYIDFLLSCNDLYGGSSITCQNVKNALQSTELDQQPSNSQEGAPCLNLSEQRPLCSTSSSVSATPMPTNVSDISGTTVLSRSASPFLSLKLDLFNDIKGNELYESSEGISNARIKVTTSDQILEATTDASGSALFQHINFGKLQVESKLPDGTDLGTYITTISQTGSYLLQWSIPIDSPTQLPNTALPKNCKVVTQCSKGAGKLQLCTFQCE